MRIVFNPETSSTLCGFVIWNLVRRQNSIPLFLHWKKNIHTSNPHTIEQNGGVCARDYARIGSSFQSRTQGAAGAGGDTWHYADFFISDNTRGADTPGIISVDIKSHPTSNQKQLGMMYRWFDTLNYS